MPSGFHQSAKALRQLERISDQVKVKFRNILEAGQEMNSNTEGMSGLWNKPLRISLQSHSDTNLNFMLNTSYAKQ